jgi:hypothetical protein
MLDLALLMVFTTDPAGCVFKEPKEPPKLEATVFHVAELTITNDPEWFRCAKKAGGKLEAIFSLGEGGSLAPVEPKPLTSYGERVTLSHEVICAKPGLKQVQVVLKGSGAMEKLDWSSNVVEIFCPACPWSGADNMLVMITGRPSPPGTWTLEATFDPTWYACAQKSGALELRLFTGDDEAELNKATRPTHVVSGLNGPKVKKVFPDAAPCKGKPKFVAYELGGTGEFQVLPPKGRAIVDAHCP